MQSDQRGHQEQTESTDRTALTGWTALLEPEARVERVVLLEPEAPVGRPVHKGYPARWLLDQQGSPDPQGLPVQQVWRVQRAHQGRLVRPVQMASP